MAAPAAAKSKATPKDKAEHPAWVNHFRDELLEEIRKEIASLRQSLLPAAVDPSAQGTDVAAAKSDAVSAEAPAQTLKVAGTQLEKELTGGRELTGPYDPGYVPPESGLMAKRVARRLSACSHPAASRGLRKRIHPNKGARAREAEEQYGYQYTALEKPAPDGMDYVTPLSARRLEAESAEMEPQPVAETFLQTILDSPGLEACTCVAIILNAIVLGLETDYHSVHLHMVKKPLVFEVLEGMFCLLFLAELLLRLCVYKLRFFVMVGWPWNWFDFVVVAMQVLDVASKLLMIGPPSGGGGASTLRVLRLARLVRIVRAFRVVRFRDELKGLVNSIVGSMQSLAWTLLLLFGLIYVAAVFFTQVATQARAEASDGSIVDDLEEWYGTLSMTSMTLYQCVTGGVDWRKPLRPLLQLSPMLTVVFSGYIAFTLFAIMNVVTGAFVEKMSQVAQSEKDEHLANSLLDACKKVAGDDFTISWTTFQTMLTDKHVLEYFQALPLETHDAEVLFGLLDEDGQGQIDVLQFVSGCLNLRGPAKAMALQFYFKSLFRHMTSLQAEVLDAIRLSTSPRQASYAPTRTNKP
eukprot:TRINITY_DN46322_c0_g1_i1.p1 TRINITY_DN46322_c0_g1~~TRINITY_DN46322_c0_g1_i1.p1  ORF type:complete len:580 (-),score=114.95 TRINITY_DN46322_c0_g1_i1:134-1873(-)